MRKFYTLILAIALGVLATPSAQAAVNFVSWPKDIIYVVDKTANIKNSDGSPRWPVRVTAEWWDNSNPVDFRYTLACPVDQQCIYINQAELPAPNVARAVRATSGENIVSVTITMDTTFGATNINSRRRNAVCHELGHGLGLDHRTQATSCMLSGNTTQMYGDSTDIKNLNTMYGYR